MDEVAEGIHAGAGRRERQVRALSEMAFDVEFFGPIAVFDQIEDADHFPALGLGEHFLELTNQPFVDRPLDRECHYVLSHFDLSL